MLAALSSWGEFWEFLQPIFEKEMLLINVFFLFFLVWGIWWLIWPDNILAELLAEKAGMDDRLAARRCGSLALAIAFRYIPRYVRALFAVKSGWLVAAANVPLIALLLIYCIRNRKARKQ